LSIVDVHVHVDVRAERFFRSDLIEVILRAV